MSKADRFELANIPDFDEALQSAARTVLKDIHQRELIKASRKIIIEINVNGDLEIRTRLRVKMPLRDMAVDFPRYPATVRGGASADEDILVIEPGKATDI